MRIILDLDHIGDAEVCLRLALEQQRLDDGGDFGYWTARDPDFSAYISATKTGVSVRGRRSPPAIVDRSGEAIETTKIGSTEGESDGSRSEIAQTIPSGEP